MGPDKKASIDINKCISCGNCTVACPFSACYVTFGGTVIASTLRDGKVSFPVRAGGVYTVQEGTAPADPVTPSDPVTPVAPGGSPSTAAPRKRRRHRSFPTFLRQAGMQRRRNTR